MKRFGLIFVSVLVMFSFAFAGYAAIQDDATPDAGGEACATPMSSPQASPEDHTDLISEATPGPSLSVPSTPVTGNPCATPVEESMSATILVEFVDIAFVPSEITISADTDVTFHFVNKGALPHSFKIDNPEVFSGVLGSGETSEVVVNLPAGEYEYYCTIPGHREAGMVGTLIVE
jgi:plastocyanin